MMLLLEQHFPYYFASLKRSEGKDGIMGTSVVDVVVRILLLFLFL